jgi:hypothetical protein
VKETHIVKSKVARHLEIPLRQGRTWHQIAELVPNDANGLYFQNSAFCEFGQRHLMNIVNRLPSFSHWLQR